MSKPLAYAVRNVVTGNIVNLKYSGNGIYASQGGARKAINKQMLPENYRIIPLVQQDVDA